MKIWEPLVCQCLQCVKVATNKVAKNVAAVVRTNSHCKKGMLDHDCIHVSIHFSLHFGHLCNWEKHQPWR